MKIDRELLELAAKAAGVPARWSTDGTVQQRPVFVLDVSRGAMGHMPYEHPWNPLQDDGDALRLAVRLRLVIHVWDDEESVSVAKTKPEGRDPDPENPDEWIFETSHGCRGIEAATRRAIVRSAAEIQLQKEREQ